MNCRIMSSTDSTVIIIPARMAASRLPRKPLADIAGKPMIQHVWERAMAADIAPVYVATDHQEIANVIVAAGGRAVITRDDHPSGSDRVFEALQIIDPNGSFETILNLQGDLPEMDPCIPEALVTALDRSAAGATVVANTAAGQDARPWERGKGGGGRGRKGGGGRKGVNHG